MLKIWHLYILLFYPWILFMCVGLLVCCKNCIPQKNLWFTQIWHCLRFGLICQIFCWFNSNRDSEFKIFGDSIHNSMFKFFHNSIRFDSLNTQFDPIRNSKNIDSCDLYCLLLQASKIFFTPIGMRSNFYIRHAILLCSGGRVQNSWIITVNRT